MNTRRLILFAASMLLLAGCATRPVPPGRSRPVSARRLRPDYALFSHPVHHGARAVVIRDAARFDRLERAEVSVDGRPVARLPPGDRLEVYVYAGAPVLTLQTTPGFVELPDVSHSYTFRPGQTYYFRVGVVGRSLDIRPTLHALAAAGGKD